jgi:hypothetical protein
MARKGANMIELKVLQAVRLKGRVTQDELAATVCEDQDVVIEAIERAQRSGLVVEGKRLRLSDDGKRRLTELLRQERATASHAGIANAYDDFRRVNADFKALVSDWQLREGEPNAHDDEEYDSAVLSRLEDTHERVIPIIAAVSEHMPRLAFYTDKLQAALRNVRAGDVAWLTRPAVDSYHTVWFELHEELILAAGLTRQDEVRAGHAH